MGGIGPAAPDAPHHPQRCDAYIGARWPAKAQVDMQDTLSEGDSPLWVHQRRPLIGVIRIM